jgi:hypothetical protein
MSILKRARRVLVSGRAAPRRRHSRRADLFCEPLKHRRLLSTDATGTSLSQNTAQTNLDVIRAVSTGPTGLTPQQIRDAYGINLISFSGGTGAYSGPDYPSVSLNVLAVGGTTLTVTATGSYSSESGWSDSTGGFSGADSDFRSYESGPSYQTSTLASVGLSDGVRTTPDVSFDADPNSGVSVYDSVGYDGQSGWFQVGGTSLATPAWAGLIAIVDQGLATGGKGSLTTTQVLTDLYSLPSSDFNDSSFSTTSPVSTEIAGLTSQVPGGPGRGADLPQVQSSAASTTSDALVNQGLTGHQVSLNESEIVDEFEPAVSAQDAHPVLTLLEINPMTRDFVVTYEPALTEPSAAPPEPLPDRATEEFDEALAQVAGTRVARRARLVGRRAGEEQRPLGDTRSPSVVSALAATGAIAAAAYRLVLGPPDDSKLRPSWYSRFPTR